MKYLSLIKFSHTVFALPFALVGTCLAVVDGAAARPLSLLLVLACMIFARSAAMAFNRYLDRDIDRLNPRTAVREIPAGQISARAALAFTLANCVLFIAAAFLLNPLCGWLSPVVLLVILGYSYTKRFTFLCHFVLGLGLGLAPVGAYLALAGQFAPLPILYGAAVLFWVAGFDIIYALQDEKFDRGLSLQSIPVRLGRVRALRLAAGVHVLCAALLVTALYCQFQWYPARSGWLLAAAGLVFTGLLIYQHRLIKPTDLSRVDLAFFTTNGIASVVFGTLVFIDLLW
ncbi:MAG: UbiA-like polyprenyltransferase [Saprospiraceae bacterium]